LVINALELSIIAFIAGIALSSIFILIYKNKKSQEFTQAEMINKIKEMALYFFNLAMDVHYIKEEQGYEKLKDFIIKKLIYWLEQEIALPTGGSFSEFTYSTLDNLLDPYLRKLWEMKLQGETINIFTVKSKNIMEIK
jgi:hypothetical protein